MDLNILDNTPKDVLNRLQNLAKEIKLQKKICVSKSKDSLISLAISQGILKETSGRIEFKDTQTLNIFLAQAIINEGLLYKKPIAELKQILRQLYFEHRELLPSIVFLILVNRYKMSWIPVQLLEGQYNLEWCNYLKIICVAMRYLELPAGMFETLITIALERGKNDGGIGILYSAVENLANHQPKIGKLLINNQTKNKNLVLVTDRLLLGIALSSQDGLNFTKQKIAEFKLSQEDKIKATAAPTTASMAIKDLISLDEAITVLEELSQDERPEILCAVIYAGASMFASKIKARRKVINLLDKFLSNQDSTVRYAVSMVMALNMKELSLPEVRQFHLKALPFFYSTDEKYEGIIRNLMFVTADWVRVDPEVALNFLKNWVKRHPKGKPINFSDRFLHTINELKIHCPGRLEKEAINWLLDENKYLIQTARKSILAQEFKIKEFHKENTDPLSEEEIVILCNEITLGYLAAEQEITLISSFLYKATGKQKLLNYFKEVFYDFAINYGDIVIDNLKPVTKHKNSQLRRLAREVIKKYKYYRKIYENVFSIKELFPSTRRGKLFMGLFREEMNKSMRKPMDPRRHPLLNLIKHVDVVGGGKSFTKIQGRFTSPSSFKEFSKSFLIARREFVNPEGAHIRRIRILEMNRELRKKLSKQK